MKDELVPIRSQAELKPGLLITLLACRQCGRDHRRVMLTGSQPSVMTPGMVAWRHTSNCPTGIWTFQRSIPEGRALRVETGEDPADKKVTRTQPRPKVVERVAR